MARRCARALPHRSPFWLLAGGRFWPVLVGTRTQCVGPWGARRAFARGRCGCSGGFRAGTVCSRRAIARLCVRCRVAIATAPQALSWRRGRGPHFCTRVRLGHVACARVWCAAHGALLRPGACVRDRVSWVKGCRACAFDLTQTLSVFVPRPFALSRSGSVLGNITCQSTSVWGADGAQEE